MSDTPRTDAAVHPTKLLRRSDGAFAEAVDAVTCRHLERELTERTEQLAAMTAERNELQSAFEDAVTAREKAEAENAKLRELLRLCKPAVRNVYPSTDPLLEAIAAAMKEEGE